MTEFAAFALGALLATGVTLLVGRRPSLETLVALRGIRRVELGFCGVTALEFSEALTLPEVADEAPAPGRAPATDPYDEALSLFTRGQRSAG